MKIPELTWPSGDEHGYDEDLLLEVISGLAVILIRGRNAWHSTWVRHYMRDATLYTDIASAKAGAETQRERGNVFYIVEAPAIQLRGRLSNVVLCDAHPDIPFGAFTGVQAKVHPSAYGDWLGGVFPGVSVRDAVSAFAHDSGYWKGPEPSEHSLRAGRLASDFTITQGRRTLESMVSEARGADYYLGWRANGSNRYTRRGANAVARQWRDLVAETHAQDGDADALSGSLAEYRDEVLKAVPHSVWRQRKATSDRESLAAISKAREAWFEQLGRVAELEEFLEEAEAEAEAAKEARLHPAETADGMRRQRERVDEATAKIEALTEAIVSAQEQSDDLYRTFRALTAEPTATQ